MSVSDCGQFSIMVEMEFLANYILPHYIEQTRLDIHNGLHDITIIIAIYYMLKELYAVIGKFFAHI